MLFDRECPPAGIRKKFPKNHRTRLAALPSANDALPLFKLGERCPKYHIQNRRSQKCTGHLRGDVWKNFPALEVGKQSGSNGHRRIQMRSAETGGEMDRKCDSDSPDDCDLENADLRAVKHGGADAAAPKEDEKEGAQHLPTNPWPRIFRRGIHRERFSRRPAA